jgi:hypothetical protein
MVLGPLRSPDCIVTYKRYLTFLLHFVSFSQLWKGIRHVHICKVFFTYGEILLLFSHDKPVDRLNNDAWIVRLLSLLSSGPSLFLALRLWEWPCLHQYWFCWLLAPLLSQYVSWVLRSRVWPLMLHLLLPLRSTSDEFGRHSAASGYLMPGMLLPSLFRLICAATPSLVAGMLRLRVTAFRFAGFVVFSGHSRWQWLIPHQRQLWGYLHRAHNGPKQS